MTARRALGIAGVTLLAGGCAPREGAVEGSVHASPLACDVRGHFSGDLAPVAAADVRLRCDDDETPLTLTRDDGRVHYRGDQELRTDCYIVVSKPGFRATTTRIEDVCVERAKGVCTLVALTTDLERI
ncbi:MAG: hypothetical protein U0414_07650 [Polyangiaceae bacterium]